MLLHFLGAFNEIQLYISKRGIKVPIPIKNIHGKYVWYEPLKCVQSCGPHAVRMQTYLPGKLLKDVQCTKSLLFESGKLLAKFSDALCVRKFLVEIILKII